MPQHAPQTSTLVTNERAWRIPVIAITLASTALVAVLLACSFPHACMLCWLACSVPALALTLSNLHYLRSHALPTVGMIPVALFSLIPALTSVLLAGGVGPAVRAACLAATIPLLLLLGAFVLWFWRLRTTYSLRPDVSPTATIIVLGGAIKRGRPCETLARRLDVTVRLMREAPGRMALVTGGPTPNGSTTEAHEMAVYLKEHGIDPARIMLEPTARNTSENLKRSFELLDQAGIDSQICVVSSDYHLWRATREARTLGRDLTPIAAPTPAASVPQQWCREVLTIWFGR